MWGSFSLALGFQWEAGAGIFSSKLAFALLLIPYSLTSFSPVGFWTCCKLLPPSVPRCWPCVSQEALDTGTAGSLPLSQNSSVIASLTHRALEIYSRTPRLPGNLSSWEKAGQRTPGPTDSEKLTSCSQKPKHSTTRTQSARNTEFFDVTRRIINKIAPRQTGWMSLLRQPVSASNFNI